MAYHVKKLVESGLQASDIAVIAPYNLQVLNSICQIVHYWPNSLVLGQFHCIKSKCTGLKGDLTYLLMFGVG